MELYRIDRSEHLYRLCRLALLAGTFVAAARPAGATDTLVTQAKAVQASFSIKLAELAHFCDGHGLRAEAAQTRAFNQHDPRKSYLPLMPRSFGCLQAARLTDHRRTQADLLFDLSQKAIAAKQPSLAYQLALETVRLNPDHAAARHVFGYQRFQDQWCTKYEIAKLQSGHVWDDRFGWTPKADLDQLRSGKRLLNGVWISATTDAQLHDNIQSGWDVESEHYRIRTNLSVPAAIALGVQLEELHRLWRQIFVGYYATDADIVAMFQPAARLPAAKCDVVCFRNHDEYVAALKPAIPNIDITEGLYYAPLHTAYFYSRPDDSRRTVNHEGTHQLFQQSRHVADNVGQKANFWVVEGVALYLESLHREDDCYVVGGQDDPRVQAAIYHLRMGDFYVPFENVAHLGMNDLLGHAEIAKLYSQLAGMTHFLMHYDDGRYREALLHYLKDVYNGSQDPALLAHHCGVSYPELDRQYRIYMGVASH